MKTILYIDNHHVAREVEEEEDRFWSNIKECAFFCTYAHFVHYKRTEIFNG